MNEYLRILKRLYDKGGYIRFTPFAHKTGLTDIKKILDNIAKESGVLTYKEKQPEMWSAHIRYLKKEKKLESDLEIINKYRVRLLNLEPIILD